MPFFVEDVVLFLFVVGVEELLSPLDLVQRRHGDVHVAALQELPHVAEEECQEKGPDVRAVHVGIRHDDDLPVAELGDVELGAHPRARARR